MKVGGINHLGKVDLCTVTFVFHIGLNHLICSLLNSVLWT